MQALTCQVSHAEHMYVKAYAKNVCEIRQHPSFSQHALGQIAGLAVWEMNFPALSIQERRHVKPQMNSRIWNSLSTKPESVMPILRLRRSRDITNILGTKLPYNALAFVRFVWIVSLKTHCALGAPNNENLSSLSRIPVVLVIIGQSPTRYIRTFRLWPCLRI
jgi:hypothetical protein